MPDHNGRPILWQPSPRQAEFLAASDDEVLYGGAAGGGKSDALMFDALGLQFGALKWDMYRALLIRKTYGETEQLLDRAQFYYPKIYPGARKSGNEMIFPSGAKVVFGYLDKESDRFQYAGDEYQWCGLDECTLHKTDVGLQYLWYFRCRSTNPAIPVMKRAATNPGNVGHAWVKRMWRIPNDGSGTRFTIKQKVIAPSGEEREVLVRRRFIPAKLWDNVHAPESFRTNYAASLQLLPEKDRRKFLDGRWDVMEGQFFTEWDPARHIVQPFEIPRDWPRWRAMDWGTAKPYSVGWYAMDFDGVIYRYRELYGWSGEANVGTRETAATVAERVRAAEADERRRKIQFLNNPADSAMWGQVGHEKSIADEFTSRGIAIRKSSAAEKSRISGWNECRQRLADGTFKVFASGEHFIRTIPDLQCDPDTDGDLLSDGEDHCFAAGTLVQTNCGPRPIEALGDASMVRVADGSWRPFHAARMTRRGAEVVLVTLADGASFVCTPDHKIMHADGSWIEAKSATDEYGYAIASQEPECASPSSAQPSKSSPGCGTTAAAATFNARGSGCIEWCGNWSTGAQCLMATMCTTSTTTAATTSPRTCGWKPLRIIWSAIRGCLGMAGRLFGMPSQRPQLGTPVMPAQTGTASSTANGARPLSIAPCGCPVSVAAPGSTPSRPDATPPSSALAPARPLRIVSVQPAGRADVYCLTVPGHEHFALACGLIVHNCADEWRYSMASRRPKARKDTRQSPPPPTSGAYLDWLAEQKRQADAGRLTGRIR